MGIGNIGWTEFLVILALALVFFGPRRLPEIASQLGKGLREFRRALNEVKHEIAEAGTESARIHPTLTPPDQGTGPGAPAPRAGEPGGPASPTTGGAPEADKDDGAAGDSDSPQN